MLVFAALLPHPLISIPEIGKGERRKLRKTSVAFRELSQQLYAAQPETILLLSPHGTSVADSFAINQRPHLKIEFSSFGDLSDSVTLLNDIGLGYKIKESVETSLTVFLIDDPALDYGMGVPLFHLTQHLNKDRIRIVAVSTSVLDLHKNYLFGVEVNRTVNRSTRRIAVVASGDLAHGASRSAPDYNPKAAAFNRLVQQAIELNDVQRILSISADALSSVHECVVRPLALLYGVLNERTYAPNVLAAESVLGVGYLTAAFHLK